MRPLATLLVSSSISISLLATSAIAQTPQQVRAGSSTPSAAAAVAPMSSARAQTAADRAEMLYRKGEEAFTAGDYDRARHAFDDSVDAILMAGLDLRTDASLRGYYLALLDRIDSHQITNADGPGFADQAYVPANSELAKISESDLASAGDLGKPLDGTYDFEFTVGSPVYQFINYFTAGRGRGTMETGLRRSGRYRAMAERIFKEEGVPTDLIWLAQVESVWKPAAYSSAAAKGIWQFIPSTGRRFGLDQNDWLDRRSSPEDSTRAAARYLKWLHDFFGDDWLLAMAAYNSGEGNVARAIARSGYADFWEIQRLGYLPTETRNYVPAILAVIIVSHNQKQYGFNVTPEPSLVYDVATIPAQTDIEVVADLCHTSSSLLRDLNPELKRGSTPPWAHSLRIPAGMKKDFETAYAALPPDQRIKRITPPQSADVILASSGNGSTTNASFGGGNAGSTYVAQNGETLASIAAKHGTTATELARVNRISTDATVTSGQRIQLPVKPNYSSRDAGQVTYRGKNEAAPSTETRPRRNN